MSIATEITRLQTAKADLKTAIEGKGVTVPSATLLDGYADLVDAIETGGGGYTDNEYANNTAPRGEMNISGVIATQVFNNNNGITKVTQTANGCEARAFQGCTSIKHFIGKGTSYFYAQVFKGCSNLEAVDVGNAYGWRFEVENFAQCSKLATLIIRKNAVIAIQNVNVLLDTPFASSGTGGTLYVPQSLISDYQSATNWSTILGYANNSIQAIEGSIYETQYADGTPIA